MRGGIFAVHKPSGITSAVAVARVKHALIPLVTPPAGGLEGGSVSRKVLQRRLKVGHGGTLDKAAEGVLVIGVAKGCKQLGSFLRCDKSWVLLVHPSPRIC